MEEVKAPKGYRIVEHPIDGNTTVRRYLVPDDTDVEDTPEGSTLLDDVETAGLMARQARPETILTGDMVRLRKSDGSVVGNVTSKLKSGKLEVKWDSAIDTEGHTKGRYEASELSKVY